MTQKEKNRIRDRDRYWYNKLHGAIPEGMTIHHNYYNELWYDEDSFIIITKEEHDWIHGCKIPASAGTDIMAKKKEYYANNREKILNYHKEYDKANKDKIKAYIEQNRERRNEQSRIYNAKVKAVRESFCLTDKQWRALTKDDRKRLMDTFEQNGGNI